MDATGNVVLQATPAYHYESISENQDIGNQNTTSVHMNDRTHKFTNSTHRNVLQTTPITHFKPVGKDLDDNLWISFVWNTVYNMMKYFWQGMTQEDRDVQNVETPDYTYVKCEKQTDQEN